MQVASIDWDGQLCVEFQAESAMQAFSRGGGGREVWDGVRHAPLSLHDKLSRLKGLGEAG